MQDETCFEQGLALVEPERREKIKKSGQKKSRMLGLAAGLLAGYGAAEATRPQKTLGISEAAGHPETAGSSEAVSGKKEAPEWIWVTAEEAIMRLSTLPPAKIEKTPGGKPYFADKQGLFLSLSHSGEYAVCAVSDVPIGVDIQKWQDTKHSILKRILCPGEEGTDLFRLWTAKEACVKCTGMGLSKDFRELFTDFLNGEVKDMVTGERWRLYTAEEPTGYSLAICTEIKN